MVQGAALQVAAVRHSHDGRGAERVARAPPQRGELVAELVVGGPDIVEELDLDDRFEPAGREPDRPAHDVGFGEWRVVDALAPELALQAPGDLEDPALPLHFLEVLLAAGVGHVFAEDDDARLARHLVLKACIEQIHHRGGIACELGVVLGVELFGGRVDVRRVHVAQRRFRSRLGRGERHVGRDADFLVHLPPDLLDLRLGGYAFDDQALGEGERAVAFRFFLALLRRLVQDLVVRERVRVGPDDVRMDERRPRALAAVFGRPHEHFIGGDRVTAVHFLDEQIGEIADELRHRAARRLHLDRHRDRVFVVLDEEQHRQLEIGRGVERLPEFALARRAVADRDVDQLVALDRLVGDVGDAGVAQPRLGAAHRLQELRARRGPNGTASVDHPS